MEQVEIGIMLPGAQIFNDQNINLTWKAHIQTHNEIIVAYVKPLTPRKLYIECACALLGRFLGLAIPKPIIVKITSENFRSIPEGQYALAFGSKDAGYPSFRRFAQSPEAMEKLEEYSKTVDVGVFDEWIANWDRNVGNILYDGGKNFSFIDHENAIDQNLKFDESANINQIVDTIYSFKSEFEKHKLNRDVQSSIIPQYKKLPLSIVSEKAYASTYLDNSEIVAVITFLENRLNSLEQLFSQRLGLQQREMAL